MIQRPQTLFLALAIIGNAIATSGISIWQKIGSSGQKAELFSNQWQLFQNGKEVAAHSTIAIALLVTLSTVITLVTIFSFKNRMRQMMLGLVNSLVLAGAMGYAFWVIFKEAVPTFEPEIQGKYGYGFYALVVSLLANMIANRLIRKDEMLVQSSNRMR
jgi:glucan phosphoethanolaminetransferase (alkaline phosphatase superfamily)